MIRVSMMKSKKTVIISLITALVLPGMYSNPVLASDDANDIFYKIIFKPVLFTPTISLRMPSLEPLQTAAWMPAPWSRPL